VGETRENDPMNTSFPLLRAVVAGEGNHQKKVSKGNNQEKKSRSEKGKGKSVVSQNSSIVRGYVSTSLRESMSQRSGKKTKVKLPISTEARKKSYLVISDGKKKKASERREAKARGGKSCMFNILFKIRTGNAQGPK